MGTTSDKLTYLNTTKQKLKDSINALGGDITSETTFRNYATELDNIYSSLPKTTGEGSNLSLSTLKGRINVDNIKGDTTQDSTTGKNLLKIVGTTQTINGLTFTQNNDGSISVSGTATATTNYVSTELQPITPSLRYRLSGCPPTGSSTTYRMLLRVRSDLTTNIATISQVGNGEVSDGRLTAPSNAYYVLGEIQVYSGQTINKTFYPQLEEIASVDAPATSYEPYTGGTASPNPTYPQEIEVVTGEQEVVVQNRNLVNNDTLVAGYIDAQGVWQQANEFRSTDFIEVIEGQTYASSFFDNSGNRIQALVWATFDSNKNFIEQKTTATITIASGVKYIRCRNYQEQSSYIINNDFKYQVELGSTATSYVEHQEQTKTLHLGDIELGSIGNYIDRIFEAVEGNSIYDSLSNETKATLTIGKWYIEKNIKKRTYASNEIVQVNGLSYTNLTYFSIPKSTDSIDYNNFATSSALFDKYLIQNVVNWDSTNNIDRISNRANALTYWIGVPLGTNIEAYRTQVGQIINYYILATPTYTEITNTTLLNELNELEKMYSYNGQTNISVNGNLPMLLSVSALKGESE